MAVDLMFILGLPRSPRDVQSGPQGYIPARGQVRRGW